MCNQYFCTAFSKSQHLLFIFTSFFPYHENIGMCPSLAVKTLLHPPAGSSSMKTSGILYSKFSNNVVYWHGTPKFMVFQDKSTSFKFHLGSNEIITFEKFFLCVKILGSLLTSKIDNNFKTLLWIQGNGKLYF